MKQSFHNLIMINQALFHKKALNRLMEIDLTPGQPKVLDYLDDFEGSMQKDIAQGCLIDPATVTGLLKRMEDKGLVERRMLNGNRRSTYVYLTDLGREKKKKVVEIFLEMEAIVFEGIDEKEREQFMKIFYKMSCSMTKAEALQ